MIAFDSDVLSLNLLGDPRILNRLSQIPPSEEALPVVVIFRNRCNLRFAFGKIGFAKST